MMRNRAEWASDHAQITKIRLSDARGGKTIPMAGGIWVGLEPTKSNLGDRSKCRPLNLRQRKGDPYGTPGQQEAVAFH